jgi:hypothetical protein
LLLLCISVHADAITGVNPSPHPPVAELPLFLVHRINLQQAIEMALKTELGKEFKTDIAELAGQGKIRLMPLNAKHYGESSEGCVIRDGRYYYEGAFILLNDKQTVPELASSLIHETDHFRQIKKINREKPAAAVKIGWLEVSAFARQAEFIDQLESRGLADRRTMFVDSGKLVFDIMADARNAEKDGSSASYALTIHKMIEFGYPRHELDRTLVVSDEEHCLGTADAENGFLAKLIHRVAQSLSW